MNLSLHHLSEQPREEPRMLKVNMPMKLFAYIASLLLFTVPLFIDVPN